MFVSIFINVAPEYCDEILLFEFLLFIVTPAVPAIETSPVPILITSSLCPEAKATRLFNGMVIVRLDAELTVIVFPASDNASV